MASFTSKASGNWNAVGATTWNEANYPVAGDTVSISGAHVITLSANAECATITNAGTVTPVTYSLTTSGAVTTSGTFGGNSNWTFAQNGTFSVTAGTFNAPAAAGTWNAANNISMSSGITCNADGGTLTIVASLTSTQQYNNYAYSKLVVNADRTFTTTGSDSGFASITLGANSTMSLGAPFYLLYSTTSTFSLDSTAVISGGSGFFAISMLNNKDLPSFLNFNHFETYFYTNTANLTLTLVGANTISGTTCMFYTNAVGAFTLAVNSRVLTISSIFSCGGATGSPILTITTGSLILNGATTISAPTVVGGNSAYVIDMNADLTITGTLSAPNDTGTFTMSGSTLTITGTYTANSGLITFDRAGTTTFTANGKTFYNLNVSAATTVNLTDSITIADNGAIAPAAGGTFAIAAGKEITFL